MLINKDGKTEVWPRKDKDGIHAFWLWWSATIYENNV